MPGTKRNPSAARRLARRYDIESIGLDVRDLAQEVKSRGVASTVAWLEAQGLSDDSG
jgi:hypothetical protein